MGAADIVPGVSGGTLALLLGIYERLIKAIRSVDHHAIGMVLQGKLNAAWQHMDGTFLLCLFSGILLSVFLLANGVSWMLAHQPVLLWALFFGLILSALPHLCFKLNWNRSRLALLMVGVGIALAIGRLQPVELEPELWMYFVAGAIAICAMILPGISGSFILLLLGMYAPVLLAVTELHLVPLALFASGCAVGLLSFSRLLSCLLARYHDATLALLIGVVIGAMYRVWPWQLAGEPVSFATYAQQNGSLQLGWAVLLAVVGILLMQGMLRLERQQDSRDDVSN
ncbi:putative membrane protein [Alkalimonas amylolytica]|uniref:Putative membrane protein n=2 Tax=Alkalimonas amylolytica TaxID=152573 RepID=A0A1H4DVZ6_ALKAM|nr:putative membrane protein [Alkalimonas amylolytica]